jgi:CHAT domain-containing protein
MNALGSRLISPLSHLLKETVYFVPAGAFMGLPVDALRHNGRYLIESHNVINLTAFPSKAKTMQKLEAVSLEKVFLAGHPQDYSSNYLSSLDTSSEISAVADLFVGPGLTIVQGTALLPDEFESKELISADLVHLSMPGVINLKYPEQSKLQLSSEEDEVERTFITPSAIRQQKISAGLVFLSSTGMKEVPDSKFSNRPAIITDFQSVGAKAVLVDLWVSEGKSKEALISMFYLELAKSGDIAESSRVSKLQALKSGNGDGSNAWAGLQLFIE